MEQDLKYFVSLSASNFIVFKSNNETYVEEKSTDYFMID